MTQPRAHWGSRLGFILAAAGSAIGLGNIWKFPYITGENGGGLFVLIYLVCIVLVGLPIMMAEIMIGRAAQRQPVAAFHVLQGHRTAWAGIGWLGVLAGFIILSYYVVVAGWAMDYTLKSVVNFTGPIHHQAELEASRYLATTDIDAMRQTLADRRAERLAAAEVKTIRGRVRPSVWRGYERFESAIKDVEQPEAARRRLLSDPLLNSQVIEAERLMEEIEAVRSKAEDDAAAHYEHLAEDELLHEAEALKRREVTFNRVEAAFLATAKDGWTSLMWSAMFMLVTIAVVAGGVSAGIERCCKILMPVLFALVVAMVLYGATTTGFREAAEFIFRPDPHKLKASGILEALGHAFFTLSLGMGAMITYGSYQRTKDSIVGQSLTIALLDTIVAMLSCMMIFPIIFSYGQEPSAGPGLVFMSMPLAFAEIGQGGMLLAMLFFGLLVFAALTSSISLLEVVASYFIDQQGWSRPRAAWVLGGAIFAFGIPSAFAFDQDFLMSGWEPSFGKNFFDTMDYLTSNWMLPLGGLLIAFYAGWIMPRRFREAEVADVSRLMAAGWLLLVRFVTPFLVLLVLLQKVGIMDADELLHGLFARL